MGVNEDDSLSELVPQVRVSGGDGEGGKGAGFWEGWSAGEQLIRAIPGQCISRSVHAGVSVCQSMPVHLLPLQEMPSHVHPRLEGCQHHALLFSSVEER